MTRLASLGWDGRWAALFEELGRPDWFPGRVVAQHRERWRIAAQDGEFGAVLSGKLRLAVSRGADSPVVGDWVAVERAGRGPGAIQTVLPRRSAFSRKAAGTATEVQVAAANVDTVFLVTGLDRDFNLSRIERYLTAAWDSGASPVVVLNKADLPESLDGILGGVERVAVGAPVLAVSAKDGRNLEALSPFLAPGKTVALLGSSGVGKSTLINRLLGEDRLRVRPVREDDSRGRHTTTHRELVTLPGGALLIDTPGMRELQLWTDDGGLDRSFGDISALAARCRFADCRHEAEPGCAVRAAVESGGLDGRRLESYHKQRRELDFLALKQDEKAHRRSEKAAGRKMASMLKSIKRNKPSYQ